MILTNEDYDGLVQIQLILAKIINNAVMSEQEELNERKFEKLTKGLKNGKAFEIILSARRKQMPKKFYNMLTEQWFKDHTRLKPNGVYEIRCTINGVPISGSSKELDTAVRKFLDNIVETDKNAKHNKKPVVRRVTFNEFAQQWFELVKKPTVKANTYQSYLDVYRTHIEPFMQGKQIDELTAMRIQPLFSNLYNKGQTKTAELIRLILNPIFKSAIAESLISLNPMDGVQILKHHSKSSTALTYKEEIEFLRKLENSRYGLAFKLMLYGGMRRAELATSRIEGKFIIVKNAKKRLSEIETERKIPITPMLARCLDGITENEINQAISYIGDCLSRNFKKLCPKHHLHELRHTFITRCQECGVPREVVSVWAGHAADNTMTSNVYTHFSEEFLLSEANKVDYYNRFSD